MHARAVSVEGPARRRCRDLVTLGVPPDIEGRRALAFAAIGAALQAGAPLWARTWADLAAQTGDPEHIVYLSTALGAWLRGWRRGQWAAGLRLGLVARGRTGADGHAPSEPRWSQREWRPCDRATGREEWLQCSDADMDDAAPVAPPDDHDGTPYRWAWGGWLVDDAGWILPCQDGPVPAPEWDGCYPMPRAVAEWWAGQQTAREECMRMVAVTGRQGGGALLATMAPCKRRACPMCARSAMRKVVWRYAPLFAARLRRGFKLCMQTIGSLCGSCGLPCGSTGEGHDTCASQGHTTNREQYRRWRKGLGRLCKAMMMGAVECGIAEGTWRGGTAVIELVPKRVGAYVHAHIVAVRTSYYPYGWSESRLRCYAPAGLGLPPRPANGWPEAQVMRALSSWDVERFATRHPHHPDPRQALARERMGFRELARRCGLGEVSDSSILDNGNGAQAYIAKVAKYVAKVQAESEGAIDRIEHRPDLLAWVKGTRRLEPFGDVRGLHGGPDCPDPGDPRWFVGLFPAAEVTATVPVAKWSDIEATAEHGAGRALDIVQKRVGSYNGKGITVDWTTVDWTPQPRARVTWIDVRRLAAWNAWAHLGSLCSLLGVPMPDVTRAPASG